MDTIASMCVDTDALAPHLLSLPGRAVIPITTILL